MAIDIPSNGSVPIVKILILDIETSPNLAHVWGLWQQNVGLPQLLEAGEVLCFAAKWHGSKKYIFSSSHVDGKVAMLEKAYALVNEADVIIHYNGKRFDMPWLNSEWVKQGWTPPSPYTDVDLYQVVRSKFRFPSNKLAYVATELLGEGKLMTGGHQLWIDCLAGNADAWARMERYNKQDVRITEKLYDHIRGWVPTLPNPSLYENRDDLTCCPECASTKLSKRGLAYTRVSVYQRYHCSDCGRWSRAGRRIRGVDVR